MGNVFSDQLPSNQVVGSSNLSGRAKMFKKSSHLAVTGFLFGLRWGVDATLMQPQEDVLQGANNLTR